MNYLARIAFVIEKKPKRLNGKRRRPTLFPALIAVALSLLIGFRCTSGLAGKKSTTFSVVIGY